MTHWARKTLNLDNSSKNTKFKKMYWIPNSTRDELFNDTNLYEEYIDRPKLTEQKKPIWVYSSSTHKWVRNN